MRPPLAGKRESARRLAEELRRRLEPVERILPVRLPGAPRPSDPSPARERDDEPGRTSDPSPARERDDEPGRTPDAAAEEPDGDQSAVEVDVTPPPADADADAPTGDVAARIEAARARLRATIVPPGDDED